MGNENKKNPPQEENTQQGGYNPAEYETMREDLKQGQEEQIDALTKAHDAQIDGVAGLVKAAEEERKTSRANDAEYQKKANAFRYIAGIGDAISGVANLVGTAHGAVNQQQHYNAPAIIQKAEAERQQRKLAMDKLNARIDELTLRGDALRAGRDAELAKLSGEHSRQVLELNLKEMAARQAAKEAEDAANLQRELQAGRQAHEASESEKNREFQATEGDKKRAHDTAMQEDEQAFKAGEEQKDRDSAERVAEIRYGENPDGTPGTGGTRRGGGKAEYTILNDIDGNPVRVDISQVATDDVIAKAFQQAVDNGELSAEDKAAYDKAKQNRGMVGIDPNGKAYERTIAELVMKSPRVNDALMFAATNDVRYITRNYPID